MSRTDSTKIEIPIKKIGIVGASARAAARSTIRAGFQPTCADYFGDADLREICCVQVAESPGDFVTLLDESDCDAWFFTGALENRPKLLEHMANDARYLGSPIESIKRVRDFRLVASALTDRGLNAPNTSHDVTNLSRCHRVLRKNSKSAGGMNIDLELDRARRPAVADVTFQEFIEGEPQSAVYVGAGGHARLIGVSQQLIGRSWCESRGFRYCGSIGPIPLSPEQEQEWKSIGDCLANAFGLVGLFGVDAIRNSNGVWPVEVNPRYTASVEIHERACSELKSIHQHVQACVGPELFTPQAIQTENHMETVHGKAILFANNDLEITKTTTCSLLNLNREQWHAVADIPEPGVIPKGYPILTVFTATSALNDIEDQLRVRADEVLDMIG